MKRRPGRSPAPRGFDPHVRPVRHHRRHAGRADGDGDPVPRRQGLARRSPPLRHLVAAHALRRLDDRLAVRPRPHVLPRDRPPCGVAGHAARGHRPYWRRGSLARKLHRAAEAVPRRDRGARTAARTLPPRDSLERRPRHARGGEAAHRVPLRRGDLGRGGGLLQAAPRHLCDGLRAPRRGPPERALRRQPRVRLHRGEGRRACAPRSSTGGAAPSAARRTSRT